MSDLLDDIPLAPRDERLGDGLLELLAFVESITSKRPDWWAKARCRGYGTRAFFAEDTTAAKRTCARCPVRIQCAEAGAGEEGVWGGLTKRERRAMRKAAG